MKQRIFWLSLVVVGFGLLGIAGAVQVAASPGYLTDPPNLGADYIGSQRCASCHNNSGVELWDTWNATMHAQTIRAADEENILGDLTDTEALTITWPDGETRPITADDITYVIGGRYTRQYISVMAREDGTEGYYVLPVVWNVPQSADQEGVWTPYHPDDWMDPARDWRVACAGCHTTGLTAEALDSGADFALLDDWRAGDVEIGIGCEACHGPAGNHNGGENPMPRISDAQVCGQCHVQGVNTDTNHPFPLTYQPGLTLEEGGFVLAAEDDEAVWWPDGHARASASQYNEWLLSGHAQSLETLQESDLAEDACLRCHAAPVDPTDPTPDADPLTLADAQFGVTCVTCHNPHPSESQPRAPLNLGGGADDYQIVPPPSSEILLRLAPPELLPAVHQEGGESQPFLLQADAYTLCTGCHNSMTPEGEPMQVGDSLHHPVQEMFEGRDVVEAVPGMPSVHFQAEEGPRCVTCHMPETAPIGIYGGAASHRLRPALPGQVAEAEPDSCTGCHHDIVTREDMQRLIDDTQAGIEARLSTAYEALDASTDDWVGVALAFIEGDGSLGIHNYLYADALLDAVEVELGLLPTATPIPPETVPIEPAPLPESDVAAGGLGQGGMAVLAAAGLILAIAAYAFFFREAKQ